jgi:hypothetical protein
MSWYGLAAEDIGHDLEFDGQGGQYKATFLQLLLERLYSVREALDCLAFPLLEETPFIIALPKPSGSDWLTTSRFFVRGTKVVMHDGETLDPLRIL